MLANIKSFFKKNYIWILLSIIIFAAAYLRLHRIEDYLIFLGDEGRDALVVRDILHGNLTLLGPRASAGDFFTGPIYYYMMVPFLFIANYNPVGPAIMIALFGIATVFLIYFFGRKWIGETGALIAAALYTVSTLAISFARSSWNPNPMPFFSILIFYLLYRAVQKPQVWRFILVGVLYGIAFQLHYIQIFVGVIIAAFVLSANIVLKRKELISNLLKQYISIAGGFIIGISPFLAFEVRHGFTNFQAIVSFILNGQPNATDLTHASFLQTISDVFFRLFGRIVLNYPQADSFHLYDKLMLWFWGAFAVILAIASVAAALAIKDRLAKLLLFLWLGFGVVLFGFYHKPIYDYYFQFMFPLPFLLVGNLLATISKKNTVLKIAAVLVVVLIIWLNLKGDPLHIQPNKQYRQVKMISEFILDKTDGNPFNFALLTLGNSDHAYRYIFEVDGRAPVTIQYEGVDPARKSVTDQLFVICEDPNCQPLGASLWEVAGFGRAEIAGEWPVSVLKVYKLVHYKGK